MHAEQRPIVLLVEDYEDAREMYRDYLEFAGFQVETAENGVEALAKARAIDPDVVLMDLSLPVMDGWEATRRLKADPATAHLPVLALSAHALAIEGERAREAGCDGFIAKPCIPADLVARLSTYLNLADAPNPSEGQPPQRPRPGRQLRTDD